MSSVTTYTHAGDLPRNVWEAFEAHPQESNIMYSAALRLRGERSTANQFWLVCSSLLGKTQTVDFVLSCTDGTISSLPIFIFSARPVEQLTVNFLRPRLTLMIDALHAQLPVQRVFSVFAVDPVCQMFKDMWTARTGIAAYSDPYYHAMLSHCTKRTLRPTRTNTILTGCSYEMRLAATKDVEDVAQLFYEFASTSEPFTLEMKEARAEAKHMIDHGQAWVHTFCQNGQKEQVACVVAVTRESATVSAITKVYTNPKYRGRGCAQRLVRKVTQSLLKHRESVVLYVAHDNLAARKVYDRVGFVGISDDPRAPHVAGVDSWIEIGFDRDSVDLGHW